MDRFSEFPSPLLSSHEVLSYHSSRSITSLRPFRRLLPPWDHYRASRTVTNPSLQQINTYCWRKFDVKPMSKRVCQIIKLKPSHEAEYKRLHASVWPGVLAALQRAHIADYSIHYYAPLQLLIATFKYTGDDYTRDMQLVAEDPATRRWWAVTDGMQESFVPGAQGSGGDVPWWMELEEVFRFEGETST